MNASPSASRRTAPVPRRVAAEALFAIVLAVFVAALASGGCSMQQTQAERPNWSLNGPGHRAVPAPRPARRYGDWNSANAPQPLTYDDTK